MEEKEWVRGMEYGIGIVGWKCGLVVVEVVAE